MRANQGGRQFGQAVAEPESVYNATTMTTIIGVDFSGARDDRNTWVTQGRLTSEGTLLFDGSQPARREDLFELLTTVPTPAVAALDFPFGVPAKFALALQPRRVPIDMPDVWRTAAAMTPDEFGDARNDYVRRFAEPKRAGDLAYFPESFSPLHRANPNMAPMTHLGMTMLHHWHESCPTRWHVPPLDAPAEPTDTVTLLELMPGAFLNAIGFDRTTTKGYKKAQLAIHRRDAIIKGLEAASNVPLPNLSLVRLGCRANDDCLDSVVAAVAAAAWCLDSTRFRHPTADELPDARLEGWIYVPRTPRRQEQR